jgi:aspartate aminotransferase-like enzyme
MKAGRRSIADLASVTYAVIEDEKLLDSLQFSKSGAPSPYRDAMDALETAGVGAVIKMEQAAKTSVQAAARKAGLSVLLAERDGVLFVKLVGYLDKLKPKQAPATSTAQLGKGTLQDAVLNAITEKPRTCAEVCDRVRAMGFDAPNSSVSATLSNLRTQLKATKKDELLWTVTKAALRGAA